MASLAIQKILHDFNVWAKYVEIFKRQSGNYRLREDEEALRCLQKEMRSLYNAIRFDFLPDPVSGDIDAPICMIMNNPGVSTIDTYNYCCIDKAVKDEVSRSLQTKQIAVCFKFASEDEQRQLENRRNVLLKQYYLNPGTRPYALDRAFDSITLIPQDGKKGKMPKCGSFLWTKALFAKQDIEDARRISQNVFDLEFFPYHTKTFNMSGYINYEQRHSGSCRMLSHSRLRNELIKEFAKDGRIFVVRSRFVKKYLIDELEVDPDQIVNFASPQSVSFTAGNLKGAQKSLKRLFALLEIK